MYLNLKAKPSLAQGTPLASDVITPRITPVKGAKVIVPNINENRLGKQMQEADPAVRLSTNQAPFNIGVDSSVNGGFLVRY